MKKYFNKRDHWFCVGEMEAYDFFNYFRNKAYILKYRCYCSSINDIAVLKETEKYLIIIHTCRTCGVVTKQKIIKSKLKDV